MYVSIEEETRLTAVNCCNLKNKYQADVTYCFIILMIGSKCFGHCNDQHQELTTIVLFTSLAISLGCCCLEVRCREAG